MTIGTFIRRAIYLIIVVIVLPFIAAISLRKNLWDGLVYWWLDMRCEIGSARRAIRII